MHSIARRQSRSLPFALTRAMSTLDPLIFQTTSSTTHPYAQIAILSLNRPKARNALSRALVDSLHSTLQEISRTQRIRGLILTSTSPAAFCAGADLAERRTMSTDETASFLDHLRSTLTLLSRLPIPTCSVIEGYALGGGMELSLATDFRVLGPRAVMALPETSLGIIPGAGGTQRALKVLGITRLKDLIFTARRVEAVEAAEMGLGQVSQDPMARARAWMEQCCENSPLAIKHAKRAMDECAEADLQRGLDFEREMYELCMQSPDRQEGLRAFKEKRKPIYGEEPKPTSKL